MLTGDDYFKKAVETMNKTWWFFGPSESEKIDSAIEYYIKAGNYYKMTKHYEKAGNSFNEAAELYSKKKYYYHDASTTFLQAAGMYKHINKILTAQTIDKSNKILLENGKFTEVGRNYKFLGEMEEEGGFPINAIEMYEKAFEYFKINNSCKHDAYACLHKATYLLIDCNHHGKALNNLDTLSIYYSGSTLNFKCDQYFFDAIIIVLYLDDLVECRKLLGKYCGMKHNFVKSIEYIMLDEIITAYENFNLSIFSEAVSRFDNVKLLKNWQIGLLLNIKKRIEGGYN